MPLGFECLYDANRSTTREDQLVDIVAVHDVHEDSLEAWTNSKTGVNWLRDFLPEDVRVGRVLAYGYDSSASALFADDAPETIQRMAESFVQELRADRQFAGTLRRPIIFVCHGMGGVLVKKSLVYSSTRTAPKVAHLWDHYVSTFAILFFGTPHGHTDKPSWLEYEVMSKPARHRVGAYFKPTDKGHSQMPRLVDNDFAPLVKQFHLFFFWEKLPTRIGTQSTLLVDHKSAAPKLDNTEAAGIHATHSDMCKFGSRTSSDYRTVIAALATYCEKASGIISRRWRQAEAALRQLRLGEVEEIGGFGFDVHLERPYQSQGIRSNDMIHFHIPEETTHTFVGCQDLLRTLRDTLFPNNCPTTRPGGKSFVVFGMGGSGKTELCSKFATENRHEYTAVFTIRAASPETIKESYGSIGQLAGLQPTESAGRHVLSQQKAPWLLIIDNADDRTMNLPRLFPPGGSAHILITTRVRDFSREGTLGSLELKGLKEAEAIQLLLTKADIPQPWDSSTTKTASLIAKALGYLALALIQAGTCVYRGVCELGGYLELHSLAKRRQRNRPPDSHIDPVSDVIEVVYSTFDVSLSLLRAHKNVQTRDASELLKMIAYFHFEFIPLELFSRLVSSPDGLFSPTASSGSWTSSLAGGLLARLEPPTPLPGFLKVKDQEVGKRRIKFALADLQSLSLIRLDGKYISLHPLIHSWARDSLTTSQNHVWASIALQTIMRSISLPPQSDTKTDGDFHKDILPHLETCLAVTGNPISLARHGMGKIRVRVAMVLQPTLLFLLRDQIRIHAKCGWVFAERGYFDKAATHLQIVRDMLVKLAGEEDEKTMNATLGLAGVLWGLGRLEEGINLGRSVVETRTRIYGPGDERTLSSMNRLGKSYWLNGQYCEALELQEITSKRMKETLGENHPATLDALDNLGVTLSSWYRYQESIDAHAFVLAARERSIGETHLDTLTTKCNLATALLELGRPEEANVAMTEVYTQRQNQLGKEHPWTLWALSDLCKVKIRLGLFDEGEEMLNWGLSAATRSLGDNHLGVLMGRGLLAQIYTRTGRLEEAEKLALDTIRRVESSRGIVHPDCVYGLWRLARLYVLRGCRAKAAETCELGLQRAELDVIIAFFTMRYREVKGHWPLMKPKAAVADSEVEDQGISKSASREEDKLAAGKTVAKDEITQVGV